MSKKIKLIISLFILSLFYVGISFGNNCNFNMNSNDCQRFSNSFIKFEINFTPNDYFYNYTAKIYNKNNPSNVIKTKINSNIVENLNPFIESGVYVLEINGKTISNKNIEYTKEFIIDKTEPLAPIINNRLNSTSIYGETSIGNLKVIAKIIGGDSVETTSDNYGKFHFNLNLNNGINLVNFNTVSLSNIPSQQIKRIIYNGGIPVEDKSIKISNLNVDNNLNEINNDTIKISEKNYSTIIRTFYVTGSVTGNDGAIVYVNGIKSIVKKNRYAAVVLLNEGMNNITIENLNGTISKNIKVNYLNNNFQFLTFKTKKIISSDVIEFNGSSNLDLPFKVYLNGKFKKIITPNNGKFKDSITGANLNKNYLFIEALNDQKINALIYRDYDKPTATMLNKNNITNKVNLVFHITDDIGIDYSSIKLKLNENEISGDNLIIKGDNYIFNISNLDDGVYNYNLSYKDRSGKYGDNLIGVININNTNTIIEKFDLGNFGQRIGNQLYLNSNLVQLKIMPSKFIAFKSIYLDGKRQTNYIIKSNKEIILNLKLNKTEGNLKFNYINIDHKLFSENFHYITEKERPKINLDYVYKSNSNSNNNIRISGEIIGNDFDWSSLNFNGVKSFERYGKYFETNIKLNNNGLNNFKVEGYDYFKNLIQDEYGSLLFNDNSLTQINLENISKSAIIGTLSNPDSSRNRNYIYKYSGINSYGTLLNNNFKLGVSEIEGLFSSNIYGYEDSQLKFRTIKPVKIDSIKPRIYLVNDSNTIKLILDGTLSKINSISLLKNGEQIDYSICNNKISLFSTCIESNELNSGNINVSISDSAGNIANKIINSNNLIQFNSIKPNSDNNPKFYFNGNDLKTNKNIAFIQGNIVSNGIIKSVKANDENDCIFDDVSFVCNVELASGSNLFNIEVEDENNKKTTKNISITLIDYDNYIKLKSISGKGTYKIGDTYYISNPKINISGETKLNSMLKLIIDNNDNELNIGEKEGNFTINIDLSNQIGDKDTDDFKIKLKSENEYGDFDISNSLHIIFNRILKTFAKVVVY